jgi:hypothetical protein
MYTSFAVKHALISLSLLVLTLGSGCGVPAARDSGSSVSQALTGTAESLEFETVAVRHDLFRDLAKLSQGQAGHVGAVVFPMLVNGEFVAAPALDARHDLLGATDAGGSLIFSFDRAEPFADDRREAFQGLSEHEAAEQIARSLLQSWGVHPTGVVNVVRVAGAPYAAAWIDGELRLNPAFVYLAAAPASAP